MFDAAGTDKVTDAGGQIELLGETVRDVLPFHPDALPTQTLILPDKEGFVQGPVVVTV